MIDFENEAGRWLQQANKDLDDARYTAQGRRFNITCFLAQQAADKALKDCLYHLGEELVLGHCCADLCKRCAVLDMRFHDIRASAAALDKHYFPTRYPNGLPGGIPSEAFDEVDAERALTLSQRVIDFVTLHLESA